MYMVPAAQSNPVHRAQTAQKTSPEFHQDKQAFKACGLSSGRAHDAAAAVDRFGKSLRGAKSDKAIDQTTDHMIRRVTSKADSQKAFNAAKGLSTPTVPKYVKEADAEAELIDGGDH